MNIKKCALLLGLLCIGLIQPSFATCQLPFELKTQGSKVVDQCGQKIKLKAVNWYGAHMEPGVVGGLDHQPLVTLVTLIKKGGFNAVRLVFSNDNLHALKPVDAKYLTANPELIGKTPLALFDVVVKALTDAGLIVILNNHTTTSKWCCGFDENGLWYGPQQTTSQWVNDWTTLAARYLDNPLVAGFDLRNEVRPACDGGAICENPDLSWETLKSLWESKQPNWGKNNQNDWKLAATTAANAIHTVNPKALIIVEGVNWQGMPYPNPLRTLLPTYLHNRLALMPIQTHPIVLNHSNKLVYQAHAYAWTGPNVMIRGHKLTLGQPAYGDLSPFTLKQVYDQSFGYVAQKQIAPVFLGEFGVSSVESSFEKTWLAFTVNYLIENDMGWSFWPLNGSDITGLLKEDWSDYRDDWRRPYIQQLVAN